MEKNTQKNKIWDKMSDTPSYPTGNMWERLCYVSEKAPQSTALRFMGKSISYGKLADSVRKLKSGFKTLGIKKGDKVMLCLPNIPEAVYSLYALNRKSSFIKFNDSSNSTAWGLFTEKENILISSIILEHNELIAQLQDKCRENSVPIIK